MVLTPLDIHNKEFKVKLKGYDQDEVNDYLDQVIKDYEIVLKQKRELEKNLELANERLGYYASIEDTLNKSIIVAQEASEEVRQNADREAKIIVLEAEKNADRVLNESLTKAKEITAETDQLKKQTRLFRQRLQLMVESQLDLIKSNEWDEVSSIVTRELEETTAYQTLQAEKETTLNDVSFDEAEVALSDIEETTETTEEAPLVVETPVFSVTEEVVEEIKPYEVPDGQMEAVDMPNLTPEQILNNFGANAQTTSNQIED